MTLTKKRKKKPTGKQLTKKADTLWSLIIRSKGYCELSGVDGLRCAGAGLQGAHVVGRRFYSTRFSLDNGKSLCPGHHTYYTHHPEAWFLLIESLHPGKWQELWDRAQVQWHGRMEDEISALKDSLSVLQGLHQEEK